MKKISVLSLCLAGIVLFYSFKSVKRLEKNKGVFTIFTQVADKTVANTTTETSLLNLYNQNNTFTTDQFVVGNYVKVRLSGIGARTNGTLTINVKMGSTVIMTTGAILTGNFNNDNWVVNTFFTYRAVGVSGKIRGFGSFLNANTGTTFQMVMLSDVTVDLTSSKVYDITATWSIAGTGNTITSTNVFRDL